MAQFFSLFGNVEDQIVESFQKGGGVPYSQYPKFSGLMAEMSSQIFDSALVGGTLELAPGLVAKLKDGIDVADVGCGRGHAINLMAKEFPRSRFIGYDFSEEGVAAGRKEAQELGLSNARFEVKDVSTLDGAQKFDLITAFDAIHDQAKPRRVLKGIADALKPDGTFLCVDMAASSNLEDNIGHPMGPMVLHDLDLPLHDGVAGAGRRGPGHDVGRAEGARAVRGGRLQGDRRQEGGGRLHEQLLRSQEVAAGAVSLQQVSTSAEPPEPIGDEQVGRASSPTSWPPSDSRHQPSS